MNERPRAQRSANGEIVVTRVLGEHDRPSWSDVTSAGIFSVSSTGHFDRHYHSCDEYWLFFEGDGVVTVGDEAFVVGPGDIVCTPAGVEHDVIGVKGTLRGFWFEGATPPGGRTGHLHVTPDAATGHPVLEIDDLASFDLGSQVPPAA